MPPAAPRPPALRPVLEPFRRLLRFADRVDTLTREVQGLRRELAEMRHRQGLAGSVFVGQGTALTTLDTGHLIYVDTRCADIAPHLLAGRGWETQYATVFRRMVRPGATVLDVGANMGTYAIPAAAAVGPSGRVLAFEPNPRLAELLRRSFHVNGLDGHARVEAVALSDAPGTLRLMTSVQHPGGGALLAPGARAQPRYEGDRPVEVPVAVLDQMFPAADFAVHAAKIDVEGHEGRVLAGMRAILARSPEARILMEFVPSMISWGGQHPREPLDLLAGLGFRFWTVDLGGGLHPSSAEALLQREGVHNLVAARGDPF